VAAHRQQPSPHSVINCASPWGWLAATRRRGLTWPRRTRWYRGVRMAITLRPGQPRQPDCHNKCASACRSGRQAPCVLDRNIEAPRNDAVTVTASGCLALGPDPGSPFRQLACAKYGQVQQLTPGFHHDIGPAGPWKTRPSGTPFLVRFAQGRTTRGLRWPSLESLKPVSYSH